MQQLHEILELSPVGLKPWSRIAGQVIHSNDKICEFIKSWVERSNVTKRVANKINHLIDKKIIIIGYENKGKVNFLSTLWKAWTNQPASKGYLGYYSKEDNKIAIILDENISLTGRAVREIPPILVHELVHMCFYNQHRSAFDNFSKKIFIPFYSTFLEDQEVSINDESELLKGIYLLSKLTESQSYNPFTGKEIRNVWQNLLIKLKYGKKNSIELSEKFLFPYLYHMGRLRDRNVAVPVIKSIVQGYRKVGINNVLSITLPVQELVFPSEVVCVYYQFSPDSTISNLINNL